MARHTIRITYVRQADRYRIDEMVDDVVRTELVEAVFNEAFAEHLAELVANFRQIDVTRLTIDDDGVVLEWERCLRCEKRACLEATIAGRCLDHDVSDHVFSDVPAPRSARRGAVVLQRRPARRAASPRARARGMSTRLELRPVRLAPGTPGTPVTGVIGGRTCAGLVQPYEPENTLTHHTFPRPGSAT